jgi:hypothetical protein
MALQLNLLHEEITEERQRKRDPLKLGVIALSSFGALLFVYYGWNAYQTIQIKSQLKAAQAEWQLVEPKVTAAQERATQLHQIIDSTKVLDGMIDGRFYWAPLLATISHCVAPNVQMTALDGSVAAEPNHSVAVALEGIAAAREPRAAAEDLRQLLIEQLEKKFSSVKVTFKSLEDLDALVILSGVPTPSARFGLSITFDPTPATFPKANEPPKEIAKPK